MDDTFRKMSEALWAMVAAFEELAEQFAEWGTCDGEHEWVNERPLGYVSLYRRCFNCGVWEDESVERNFSEVL